MPRPNVGGAVQALFESVARAVARDLKRGLVSSRQLARLDSRVRDLDRRLARWIQSGGAPAAPGKRRGGRPRQNPETCLMRGCTAPARAKSLCSRHYQQERRGVLSAPATTRKKARSG